MTTKPTPEQRKAASEKMGAIFSQQETNYVTLSATPGQACANCIFYRSTGYDGVDWPHCHLVLDYPNPIEPTGWCERYEMKPAPPEPGPTIEEAIEDLAGAIGEVVGVELSEDGARDVFITPADGLVSNLRKALTSKLSTGLSVLKDAAGRRYMFMVTSNGYKDRDKEHVATKALQGYVSACWTGDDTAFIGDNAHYIWHIKELGSMSDLLFADVWDGFLVELWREQDQPIAKAFYNFVEAHPEIEWGASHGFQGVLKGDTFTHIHKFESSTLPLDAAANLLTLSEVLPMTMKSKRDNFLDQLFKEQFGIEGASKILREGTEKLKAELSAHGVQAKALGEGSDVVKEARAQAMADAADTLISLVELQDEFEKQLDGYKTENATLRQTVDTLSTEVKELRDLVNAGPRRPSNDQSTVVTDEAAVKAAQEQQVEYDPAFPGMKVPLPNKS